MDRICLRQKKNASVCCIVTTSSTLIMSMPHGLVVRRDWLPRLLAGEVAYVVKASKTMRRGTVYLVESGTGRVAAAATLTDVRQFNSAEKASPILREECGEPALHFAYGWFFSDIKEDSDVTPVPSAARSGRTTWLSPEIMAGQVPAPKQRSTASRGAWPKRFPRKPRSDKRTGELQPKLKLRKVPRASGKKKRGRTCRLPANHPAAAVLGDGTRGGEQSLAFRLAAGRTSRRLLHLSQMHLFHQPTSVDEPIKPASGLAAYRDEQLVYILSTYNARGKPMSDVLPLHATTSGQHTALRRQVLTCPQTELQLVGCKVLTLWKKNARRGRLQFDVMDAVTEVTKELAFASDFSSEQY